jgi:fermentation-respiration switch protein FrsA (DUF1100 family)
LNYLIETEENISYNNIKLFFGAAAKGDKMTRLEIGLIIAGCFIAVQLLIYFGITGAVIRKLMKPDKRSDEFLIDYETREKKFQKEWLDIPYRAMSRQSRFGYGLFARLYMNETPTDKFILLIHGHNNSSIGQLKYLELFRSLGYNVFIPDHRRSGQSGGDSITFGHYEKYDVIDWIDILQKEFPGAKFGIFGESMGGATATMVAAMDSRIRFLIEYCGYADMKRLASPYMKSERLYNFLKLGFAVNAYILARMRFKEIDALSAMKKLQIPVLIMHSKADTVVDVSNAYAFSEANPKARLKLFEEALHARSIVKYPDEYKQTVKEFLAEVENQ